MPYWSSKVAFYIIYLEKENVLNKFFQAPIVHRKVTSTATTNSGIPDPSAVSVRKKTLFIHALHSASPLFLTCNLVQWSVTWVWLGMFELCHLSKASMLEGSRVGVAWKGWIWESMDLSDMLGDPAHTLSASPLISAVAAAGRFLQALTYFIPTASHLSCPLSLSLSILRFLWCSKIK